MRVVRVFISLGHVASLMQPFMHATGYRGTNSLWLPEIFSLMNYELWFILVTSIKYTFVVGFNKSFYLIFKFKKLTVEFLCLVKLF